MSGLPSRHDILAAIGSFSEARKFKGSNWLPYKQEFRMAFAFLDARLWTVVNGDFGMPDKAKDSAGYDLWQQFNNAAKLAIYRTIADDSIRLAHCPDTKTAPEWWSSLTGEYQKNTRSSRIKLKQAFYNPVHDAFKPVESYIDSIVAASNDLAAIGRAVDEIEIADSIIMHLDPSWETIKTILQTRHKDPTVQELRDILLEHQRSLGVSPDSEAAHYTKVRSSGRGKPSRRRDDSDSDTRSRRRSDSRYDLRWLDPRTDKDCRRCGQYGHIARYCMHDMPSDIKDKVRARRDQYKANAVLDDDDDDDDDIVAGFASSGPFLVEDDPDDDTLVTLRPASTRPSSSASRRPAHAHAAFSRAPAPVPSRDTPHQGRKRTGPNGKPVVHLTA